MLPVPADISYLALPYSASQKLLNVTRKRKLVPADTSESSSASRQRPAVPHLIQGELARLESKFRVSRDTSQAGGEEHDSGLGLRLRCHIGRL